jgi:hypothetical protein
MLQPAATRANHYRGIQSRPGASSCLQMPKENPHNAPLELSTINHYSFWLQKNRYLLGIYSTEMWDDVTISAAGRSVSCLNVRGVK